MSKQMFRTPTMENFGSPQGAQDESRRTLYLHWNISCVIVFSGPPSSESFATHGEWCHSWWFQIIVSGVCRWRSHYISLGRPRPSKRHLFKFYLWFQFVYLKGDRKQHSGGTFPWRNLPLEMKMHPVLRPGGSSCLLNTTPTFGNNIFSLARAPSLLLS